MKKTGITRKQAIKKMGKYAALTAIGTFTILNPKKAQAQSAPPSPGKWQKTFISFYKYISIAQKIIYFLMSYSNFMAYLLIT